MASVYLGRDDQGRDAAVKVLDPERVLEEDVRRFAREYELVAPLNHPHIVRVYETGDWNGFAWMALEYVDGSDLEQLLLRWQTQPPADRFAIAATLTTQIASALAHVHDQGLIHRDLKPANVFLTSDGMAKLGDFGVVKSEDNQSQLTTAGRLVGTIAYMAPELISDAKADHRTDLYGLGAILYGLLTDQRPIEAESLAGYLAAHLTEVPRRPREINPEVPGYLDRLAMKLLAKAPVERPATARAVLQALEEPDDTEPDVPIRGQDDLLTSWDELLQTLEHGQSGSLLLTGPRGAGKSRLLEECFRLAETRPDLTCLRISAEAPLPSQRPHGPHVLAFDDLDHAPRHVIEDLATYLAAPDMSPALLIYTGASLTDELCLILHGRGDVGADMIPIPTLHPDAVRQVLGDQGVPRSATVAMVRRIGPDGAYPGAVRDQLAALLEAGWLVPHKGRLKSTVPHKDWTHKDLPVPRGIRRAFAEILGAHSQDALEILQLFALLRRAASSATVERAATVSLKPRRVIDLLRSETLLRDVPDATRGELVLTSPHLGTILRDSLDADHKQALHLQLATALGAQRRRNASAEVADHLAAAGRPLEAAPIYLAAARRSGRSRRHAEVLQIWASYKRLGLSPPPDEPQWAQLAGAALVALGRWTEAVELLQSIIPNVAHVPGRELAAIDLGRAHYRLKRYDIAREHLEAALPGVDEGSPEKARARRALADILMRSGQLGEATSLLDDALQTAIRQRSADGEARVRRSLGHIFALKNQFEPASEQLELADELMLSSTQPYVRAGILARAVEIDLALGKLGIARNRSQLLVDLLRQNGIGERLPRALALQATTDLAAGRTETAQVDATRALLLASSTERPSPQAVLRAFRVHLSLGHLEQGTLDLLFQHLTPDVLADPLGQQMALQARYHALLGDHERARHHARRVMARPAAPWSLPRAHMLLDAGHALLSAGVAEEAIEAAEQVRDAVTPGSPRGILLQAWTLQSLAGDPSAREPLQHLAEETADDLPPSLRQEFHARTGRTDPGYGPSPLTDDP